MGPLISQRNNVAALLQSLAQRVGFNGAADFSAEQPRPRRHHHGDGLASMGPLISQRNNAPRASRPLGRRARRFNGAADFSAEQRAAIYPPNTIAIGFNGAADFSAEQQAFGE